MRPIAAVLPALAALLLAAAVQAQPTVSWTIMPRQWPIARLEAPTVYDSVNQRMLVFAGYDHAYNRNNEVWEYDPALQSWRNVTPTGGARPVPRSGSTAAYDAVRQRVVLFGGLDDARAFLGDTWEWDCNARTWTQVATGGTAGVDKPNPRQGARLVHDPAGDRLVLFGGIDQNQFYRDTWTYAPGAHTWSKLTTSVSSSNGRLLRGRGFHGLTISSDNRIFLFAGEGYNADFPYPGGAGSVLLFEDLWELVGTTWTDRTPSGIAAGNHGACSNAAACPGKAGWRAFSYDPNGHRLVTQGGYWFAPDFSSAGNLKTTSAYSLATGTWSLVSSNIAGNDSIAARDSHAFVSAPGIGKLILYGGYLSDVWELQGSAWTSPPAFDPRTSFNVYTYPQQDYHALAWDSTRGRVLAVAGGASEVWRLDPATWSWSIAAVGSFTERVGHAVAYSPVLDRLLMFGGRCKSFGVFQTQPDGVGATCGASGTLFNDLRAFNPATGAWTSISPSGGPPAARWDHALVYDAAGSAPGSQKFVLYGGRTANDLPYSDTWVLTCSNATTCSWSAGPAGPPGRFGHAMAYDPGRQRIVLFGGDSGVGPYGDVWEWNGSAWSNVTPGGPAPTARRHPALAALGASASGLLMFGGNDGSPRNDAWIWTGTQWLATVLGGAAPVARENPELVLAPSVGRIVLYGGFDAAGRVPGDLALVTRAVKGDLDGSDTTDLVLRSPSTPNPVIWTMSGVVRLTELTASAALAASEQIVGVDDFDYDGRNDFAVWNASTGVVTFWFMNGATRLGTATLGGATPLAIDWKPAATADFNHDGKPDLLWRNSVTQKMVIWTLGGTTRLGAYAPNPDQAIDPNWEVVGALDYNADGNTDLLWYNWSSGKTVLWFMNASVQRVGGQFTNPPAANDANWKVLAAGDYGVGPGGVAGTNDIVWRNATSGKYVVWYMDNAGNRTSGSFTVPEGPANALEWTIAGPR